MPRPVTGIKASSVSAEMRGTPMIPPLKKPAEPSWMPIIVATMRGEKRLRRIEYRVVRAPDKVGRVQLSPPPPKR
jgi:hypothetical protein